MKPALLHDDDDDDDDDDDHDNDDDDDDDYDDDNDDDDDVVKDPFKTISNWSISATGRRLTGTIIPDQSGPGSTGNEEVAPYTSELQNWRLTTGCSSVSRTLEIISEMGI